MGNPTGFHLSGGHAHDLQGSDALIDTELCKVWIADKAYDAMDRMIQPVLATGGEVVIPPKSNRKEQRCYDSELYKSRHLIENFFARLKQYRAIATRYDKLALHFLSAIYLAASVVWLN